MRYAYILNFICIFINILSIFKLYAHEDHNKDHIDKDIMYIAIIGGGPAGFGAGLYAGPAYPTVIFEGEVGGQLWKTDNVINWLGLPKLSGPQIVKKLEKQITKFGAYASANTIVDVDFSVWPFKLIADTGKQFQALSVIIASGAIAQRLGVEGEQQYLGKGVAGCTTCDALFTKGQDTIIVGGNDRSLEMALKLAVYAHSVKLLVPDDSLMADQTLQDKLSDHDNISILYNKKVKEISGNGKHVTHITVRDMLTNQEEVLDTRWVFISVGFIPNTKLFKEKIPLTYDGYIKVLGRTQCTPIKGIFAAGNVEDKLYNRSGVIAAASGMKSALDAIKFLDHLDLSTQEKDQIKERLYKPKIQKKAPKVANIPSISKLKSILKNASKPVFLKIYLANCPDCQKMLPLFNRIAHKYKNIVDSYKIERKEVPEIGKYLNIIGVPTFVLFKNGKENARAFDALSEQELDEFIKKNT